MAYVNFTMGFFARPMVELPFSAIDFEISNGIYDESLGGWQVKN